MKIYLFSEHDDIEEVRSALAKELSEWAEPKTTVTFINRDIESVKAPKTQRPVELGVELSISKVQKLKEPLNALYKMSKSFHCDFVVGVIDDEAYQDVCYFGDLEGRPDMYEIANYLGMND